MVAAGASTEHVVAAAVEAAAQAGAAQENLARAAAQAAGRAEQAHGATAHEIAVAAGAAAHAQGASVEAVVEAVLEALADAGQAQAFDVAGTAAVVVLGADEGGGVTAEELASARAGFIRSSRRSCGNSC